MKAVLLLTETSQVALVIKNPAVNAGDERDVGLIPGLGRSLGGGHGNLLKYFCLENWAESDVTEVTSHTHTHTLFTEFWKCDQWCLRH